MIKKLFRIILKILTIWFAPVSHIIIDLFLKDKTKSNNILKIFKKIVILPLTFLIMFSLIIVLIQDDSDIQTKKVTYTLVTKEQYEKIYIELEGHSSNTPTGNLTITNEDGSQDIYIPIGGGDMIQEWVDFSKLTNSELDRIKQYVEIIESAANQAGIPAWPLYSFNALEYNIYSLPNSKIKIGNAAFDKAGLEFNSVHSKTSKIVDYYNYGREEASYDGVVINKKYQGPFQLDRDLNIDHYNFSTSPKYAIEHMNTLFGYLEKPYKNAKMSDNIKYMMAMTVYNTGQAGFMARVPQDALDTFIKLMERVISENLSVEFANTFLSGGGYSAKVHAKLWVIADTLGFNINKAAKGLIDTYEPNYTVKNTVLDNGSHGSSWPGNTRGERKSGYTDYFYKVTDSGRGNKHGWAAYKIGNNDIGIIFSYEDFRYLIGSYAVGNMIRDTCMKALEQSSSSQSANTPSAAVYRWEEEQVIKDGQIISSTRTINPTGYTIQGDFNEVGYKGNFPLFVQSTLLDETSKLPWKFNGSPTTLGESGCSLFAMTSLIHGAGYGDKPIPNADSLGTDGLNENGYISVASLSKILTNGPLLADSANKLGYTTKEITTTDEGLEEIYKHLKEGIPFVVNVRCGDITGYDRLYKPHTVHFTNTGHFILLVGAYELQGTRYIEVVQSTYSNAGTLEQDQNVLVYDFDELKEKKIFRSSGGYTVPAYTITGTYNGAYGSPEYMKTGYRPPIRTESYIPSKTLQNDSIQSVISIQDLIEQIKKDGNITLPTEMKITVNKRRDSVLLYINDTTALEVNGVDFDKGNIDSGTYSRGTYVAKILSTSTFSRVYDDGNNINDLLVIK